MSVELLSPEASLLGLQVATLSLCLHTDFPLNMSVSKFALLYMDSSRIGWGPTLVTPFPLFTSLTALSPIESLFEVMGSKTSTMELGWGTVQLKTVPLKLNWSNLAE